MIHDTTPPPTRRPAAKATTASASPWGAERLLLSCLLGIGLVGLLAIYSGRPAIMQQNSASLNDTLQQDGKVRYDHMILRLNQRRRQEASSLDQPTPF